MIKHYSENKRKDVFVTVVNKNKKQDSAVTLLKDSTKTRTHLSRWLRLPNSKAHETKQINPAYNQKCIMVHVCTINRQINILQSLGMLPNPYNFRKILRSYILPSSRFLNLALHQCWLYRGSDISSALSRNTLMVLTNLHWPYRPKQTDHLPIGTIRSLPQQVKQTQALLQVHAFPCPRFQPRKCRHAPWLKFLHIYSADDNSMLNYKRILYL